MIRNILVVLALSLGPTGCEDIRDTRNASGSTKNESPDRTDSASAKSDIRDLFKNHIEFTVPELTGGKTNCDDIIHRDNIASEIVPWPKELKSFLADSLANLPIRDQVVRSVFAIYLVNPDVLRDDQNSPAAAGLACDRGTDYKGIIFLNAETFITDRRPAGIDKWQDLRSIQEQHILLESGDNAVMTLFHETMHAIDNKLLINGLNEELQVKRAAIFDLSWTSHTSPRFERISILSLKGDGRSALQSGCRTRSRDVPLRANQALSLTADLSPETLAADLKRLADESNFIVPYATVTGAEDFAESLTVYYFGAYMDHWQTRTVYQENISAVTTAGASILYVHSAKNILQNSQSQREKICLMADLVFGSCRL